MKKNRQLWPEIHLLSSPPAIKFNFEERSLSHSSCQDSVFDHLPGCFRAKRYGSGQSQASDFTNADRVVDEPSLVMRSPHEAQVKPHRFRSFGFADMHGERVRQVSRPILPGRKRRRGILKIGRPQANAKGRCGELSTKPSFPEQSALCILTLRLSCITHPEQLNHGIGERETTVGGALTCMLIRRSLMQAELYEFLSFGCA